MRGWLASVTVAAVVSVIAEMLSPEGKTKRYVSFALSAVLLLALLAPLPRANELGDALGELLSGIGEESAAEGDAALEVTVRAAELALRDSVCNELKLSSDALSLSLRYEAAGESLRLLGVSARVRDPVTGERVRTVIERETGVKCEVIVS